MRRHDLAGTSLFLFRKLLRENDDALELLYGRGELLAAFAEEAIKVKGSALVVNRSRAAGG